MLRVGRAVARPLRIQTYLDDCNSGHISAQKPVNEALTRLSGRDGNPPVETRVFNFFELSSPERKHKRSSEDAALIANMRPGEGRDLILNPSTPEEIEQRRKWAAYAAHESFPQGEEMVRREDPDMVFSVHMDTNHASEHWAQSGALKAPTHCLITDYVGQPCWANDNVARYYVATDAVKGDLVKYGIEPGRILVLGGLPTRNMTISRPPEEVKKDLGLEPQRPMILMEGGTSGYTKYADILRELQKLGNTAQVVALCGRDDAQGRNPRREEVHALAGELAFPVIARGFVNNVEAYRHAAQVVITKPGGLTTAECFTMGKATVVASPCRPMEEIQAERLAAEGVTVYSKSPEETAVNAVRLLRDDAARETQEAAARKMGERNVEIAEFIAQDLIKCSRGYPGARQGGASGCVLTRWVPGWFPRIKLWRCG